MIRGKGIEGLVEEYAPGVIEEEKIEVVGVDKFAELLEKYERFLSIIPIEDKRNFPSDKACQMIRETITETLTPQEINAFLQATSAYEYLENYSTNTGLFITELIKNSYKQGHDNCYLDTIDLPSLNFIGYSLNPIDFKLNATEKKLVVTIYGDVGNACGAFTQNVVFDVRGSAGELYGFVSRNSTFRVRVNAGWGCGGCTLDSTFIIEGDVGAKCGDIAHHSTFKTPNQKTLEKLKNTVLRNKGNKIIFIHPDGREQIVQDL